MFATMMSLPPSSDLRPFAGFSLDYPAILRQVRGTLEETIIALAAELPNLWRDVYVRTSNRSTSIVRILNGPFEYLYDNYSYLEASGTVPYDLSMEDRVVAVCGRSAPITKRRDDYRLRGWVGPTEKMYSARFDKGHYIAHSIGGAVDRSEMNVFVQRRDLNRGWSQEGKQYRTMEKYCVCHTGTFCFTHPLYDDQTSIPSFIEFGVLKSSDELWVECFDNR
jgi:hypothetical protein